MAASKKKSVGKASKLRIEYYRSSIGLAQKQKNIVKGLGFRRLNAVRELVDSVEVRGMIAKIPHLVRIIEE